MVKVQQLILLKILWLNMGIVWEHLHHHILFVIMIVFVLMGNDK